MRISAVETPVAAGSRWRTAATSRRSSPDTRRIVLRPHIRVAKATRRSPGSPRGDCTWTRSRVERREVDGQERVHQRRGRAGEQLDRLERHQRSDHARRRADHAGLGARRRVLRLGRERAAVARAGARKDRHHEAAPAGRAALDEIDPGRAARGVDRVAGGERVGAVDRPGPGSRRARRRSSRRPTPGRSRPRSPGSGTAAWRRRTPPSRRRCPACSAGTGGGGWRPRRRPSRRSRRRPTPAPARYSATGEPSAPAPITSTLASRSASWTSSLQSGSRSWRE